MIHARRGSCWPVSGAGGVRLPLRERGPDPLVVGGESHERVTFSP